MIVSLLNRIGRSRLTPPLTLLWLALIEGPTVLGGVFLGMAVVMGFDIVVRDTIVRPEYDHQTSRRKRGHC